jgi:hypothetical protein
LLVFFELLFINMVMLRNSPADNDGIVYDLESVEGSNHHMAKILRFIIMLGQIILATAALLIIIAAVWMAFSDNLQDQLHKSLGGETRPNRYILPLMCLGMAAIATAWFWVLNMLKKIVDTLIAGDPFVPENINRLRRMWIVIALTEIFRMGIVSFPVFSVANSDEAFPIRIGTWFLVFVIATLAEAFRYGAAMRRDQELTI